MPDVVTTFPHLLAGKEFLLEDIPTEDGRVEVYEPFDPTAVFVIGNDGAYGIEGRDFDAGVVLRKKLGEPARQVAELHGHWGERYDRLLYAVAIYYGSAFVVMERQCGLATLRRLHDEYAYEHLYYERAEKKAGRRFMDTLGHPKVYRDVTLRNLRKAMMEGEIDLRSRTLLDQMQRLEFHAPGEDPSTGIRKGDEALTVRLPRGGSPDLVMAAAYAWLGFNEVDHFPPPKRTWAKDTLGHLLGHEDPDEDRQDRATLRNQRLRKRR